MSGTTVKLWYVGDTAAARRYCRLPLSRHPADKDYLFVPTSLIEHCRRWPAEGSERPVHEVTLPDWFVVKEKL